MSRSAGPPTWNKWVLNQECGDSVLPVDVTDSLRELGFFPFKCLKGGLNHLLTAGTESTPED